MRKSPRLDEKQKAEWRKRALGWLKADLDYWTKQFENGTPEEKQTIRQTLEQWKTEPGLAAVRDQESLKRLPDDEMKAFSALWDELNSVLDGARGQR